MESALGYKAMEGVFSHLVSQFGRLASLRRTILLSDEGREEIQDWGRRGRSFSIFQCSEHDAAQIAEILGEVIPDLTTVHPSDWLDLPEPSGPVLLYNIAAEDAYKNADALHRLVIRLILWENESVFLLSPDHLADWERGDLWLGDGKIDKKGLQLDSLFLILKQDGLSLPTPAILDLVSDQPEMTYIEQRMAEALDAKGLCFRAQALIGQYHVDFLVEKNGAQVVVECDGKAYHSSDEAKRMDRKRDSYLESRGYPVRRFTGGEINSRVNRCVEQIKQSLDKPQMEQSQGFRMDDNLDDSQQKAVFTNPGQVCVLAPAGSGKTKVLTNRGIHLLSEGFREHRVLAMAFNNKAREEMQARLREMGFSGVDRQVHTFNSYGAQLLDGRYSLKGRGFAPNEHAQYSRKLFAVLEKHCGELRKIRGLGQSLRDAIERTKRELAYPGQFLEPVCKEIIKGRSSEKSDLVWSTLFEDFLQWQEENDHLTFADQVYLAVRELAENQDLRRQTQMSIDALLIDEFQDLDAAQTMLVEILALGHGNLFVVGDDDQMIYGWRGADIERLRRFLKDPNTRKIVLSTNYRSSQLVVRHAGYLISHNEDREAKNVHPKEEAFRGEVELFIGDDIGQECSFLVQALNRAGAKGLQWKELAVLVRYRELYRAVLDALDRASIPVDCKDYAPLYSTRAARAVAGYFMAVLDWPSPPKSVWRDILNVPNRLLRHKYADQIGSHANPIAILRAGKDLNDSQRERVLSLLKGLEGANDALKHDFPNAYDLFQSIDVIFGLTTYFKKESGASDDNDAADYGLVIDQVREKSKQFSDPREFLAYCRDEQEKEEKEPVSARKDSGYGSNSKDAVELMTIHKAKGKEWRGVILFHQEWRKPYSFEKLSSDEKKSLEEEERRVVYVGATRAREALWVTARRKSKSRFVDELFRDPGFRDRDPQQEIEYRQERVGNLKQEIDQLKTEENQEHIKVDRAQGIEQDRVRRELDAVKESAGFLRRLLWRLGLKSARLRQLEKECQTVEKADQAEQRVDQIQSQLDAKKKRIAEISEEMDRLRREVMFRRILSDPIEEGNSSQAAPF
jgi:DNA helicase-2/ATP-dependent DNA helicase PcrA